MAFSKKLKLGCGAIVVVLAGAGLFFGPAIADLWEVGKAYLEKDEKRTYSASSVENLKALHTAMMLYHESEGQFPVASGWMDALRSRVQTNDLDASEAMKKFVRPGAKPGEFGYAMNSEASGKYEGDLPKETILVFESDDMKWNASAKPTPKDRGITISGALSTDDPKTQ
ncbi:MAG TPA: hypothetical protein PKA27_02605 [Fimbriimonadaceae bacterium]|nr:hypothetical protein [Fimbriimonadaceae bacterium]